MEVIRHVTFRLSTRFSSSRKECCEHSLLSSHNYGNRINEVHPQGLPEFAPFRNPEISPELPSLRFGYWMPRPWFSVERRRLTLIHHINHTDEAMDSREVIVSRRASLTTEGRSSRCLHAPSVRTGLSDCVQFRQRLPGILRGTRIALVCQEIPEREFVTAISPGRGRVRRAGIRWSLETDPSNLSDQLSP